MRGHGCGAHPCGIPNRDLRRCGGTSAAPIRSGRRGVLRVVGLPAVARSRGGRARTASSARYRTLSAVPAGSHHAGLPVRRCGDSDAVARGQPRQSHRLVGQSDPDPGVRSADIDRRADSDVEPVGGGQFLSGAADPGVGGLSASGPRSGTGDRGGGSAQSWVGPAAHPHRHGRELSQLATGVRVLVRGRDAACGVDGEPGRLAAPTGPQLAGHHGDRTGGLSGLGIAPGRAGGSGSGHPQPVRGADLDGRHRRRRTTCPTGARPPRHPAPHSGQSDHGGSRPLVLRIVRVALGRTGDGLPNGRQVHVHRKLLCGVGPDDGAGFRHGGGQLRADRVAVPECVASLGVSAGPTRWCAAAPAGQLGY